MSEQKHIPGHGTTIEQQIKAIKAEVDMYTSRMTWHSHQKALDDAIRTIEQVAELTKESERLGNIVHETNRLMSENQGLTEQVEKLKRDNEHQTKLIQRCIHPDRLPAELSRLREREKELVEALREFCRAVRKSDVEYPDWVGTSEVYDALFKSESLLSKFEAPNV